VKRPDDRRGPIKLAVFGSKMVHPMSKTRNYVVIVGVGRSVGCSLPKVSIEVVDAAFPGDTVGPELAADRDFWQVCFGSGHLGSKLSRSNSAFRRHSELACGPLCGRLVAQCGKGARRAS
jgi:hypothetical protein